MWLSITIIISYGQILQSMSGMAKYGTFSNGQIWPNMAYNGPPVQPVIV